ncbi:hypothetical protein GOV14_04695 [Candidatus Pacearchaeota archaeon]|nr:hypothetical protein [Candidatus Pacearchaeota archaeon]
MEINYQDLKINLVMNVIVKQKMDKNKPSYKIFHNKKSQGISINVIIIAAIALIVLVVLIAVFTGRFGIFSEGLNKATTCNEACAALDMKEDASGSLLPGFKDQSEKECYCK